MKDLELVCVLDSWQRSKTPYPLYIWGLIDVSRGKIVKFFLFYNKIKFTNITRNGSAPAILRKEKGRVGV